MILHTVIDKNDKVISQCNIFNATLKELIPKDRKYIEKVSVSRDYVKIYYMDGKKRLYSDLH